MKHYITREQECPFCGHVLNRAVDPTDAPKRPQPGDLTICVVCEAILVWNAEMRLELYDETNTDPETKAHLAYARLLIDKAKHEVKNRS